jgi:hypothetical protein
MDSRYNSTKKHLYEFITFLLLIVFICIFFKYLVKQNYGKSGSLGRYITTQLPQYFPPNTIPYRPATFPYTITLKNPINQYQYNKYNLCCPY